MEVICNPNISKNGNRKMNIYERIRNSSNFRDVAVLSKNRGSCKLRRLECFNGVIQISEKKFLEIGISSKAPK